MGLIEQIRSEGFQYWQIKSADTLAKRFDEVAVGDWTICFNDNKYNPFSRSYEKEKTATFTCGVLYQVLDKKSRVSSVGGTDLVIQIMNDKNKKIWVLTDRFAYGPELAQNNLRENNLKWILDDEDVELT
jgi:hypothetical protein